MRLPPSRFRLRAAVVAETSDIGADEQVLVACSGGPDSLALAQACADAALPARVVVVDHQLQSDSAAVANEALRQCYELGLPGEIIPVAVSAAGEGLEAAARQARYEALDRCAAAYSGAMVLLGHTGDDQAETVLLGLARGSGTRSLAGMGRRRGQYRRPFLGVERAVVEEALGEGGLTPWRDPHNTDERFLRTRVRSEVLPLLERELGPGVSAALQRTATLARADADALDEWARREFRSVGVLAAPHPQQVIGLCVHGLVALPDAIRWRVLRLFAITIGVPAAGLGMTHIFEVDRLVTHWRGQGPLHLPGGVKVLRSCDTLFEEHAFSQMED